MQQSYAKLSGVKEIVNVRNLVEDSLRMNPTGLDRQSHPAAARFRRGAAAHCREAQGAANPGEPAAQRQIRLPGHRIAPTSG